MEFTEFGRGEEEDEVVEDDVGLGELDVSCLGGGGPCTAHTSARWPPIVATPVVNADDNPLGQVVPVIIPAFSCIDLSVPCTEAKSPICFWPTDIDNTGVTWADVIAVTGLVVMVGELVAVTWVVLGISLGICRFQRVSRSHLQSFLSFSHRFCFSWDVFFFFFFLFVLTTLRGVFTRVNKFFGN